MDVLLDECVDQRLARDLTGHHVRSVPQMGWAGIKNGRLMALAEQQFDVFVTVDPKPFVSTELAQVHYCCPCSSCTLKPFDGFKTTRARHFGNAPQSTTGTSHYCDCNCADR